MAPQSRRQELQERRSAFMEDTSAQSEVSALMSIIIGYILIAVIGVTLFVNAAPDTSQICSDIETSPGVGGNFTQEDCDGARAVTAGFWTVFSIVTVVFLIITVALAMKAVKKAGG